MRWLELFAGAGGAACGIRAAGHEALACVEIDEDAVQTLHAAGFPAMQADLSTTDQPDSFVAAGFSPDALWSSFPCQAWSISGRRDGARDDRNGWPWTSRIIRDTAPRWVVLENVEGLTFHNKACRGYSEDPLDCPACYFQQVILAELAERYDYVGWRVLNAVDFGLPQSRPRVYVIAGPTAPAWPKPTHGDRFVRMVVEHHGRRSRVPFPVSQPHVGLLAALGLEGLPGVVDRPAHCVSATEVKGSTMYARSSGKMRPNRASDTLHMLTGERRLSIEQAAILQGFDAAHPWHGNKESQYRQIGNAVPPLMARLLAKAIEVAG